MFTRVLPSLFGMLSIAVSGAAQIKRPVTPRDCVQTNYLLRQSDGSLKINRQGNLVAYLVKAPNLQTNANDIALYVRPLWGDAKASIKLLEAEPGLSQISWLADGRHIAALAPVHGHVSVVLYDVQTAKKEVLTSVEKDIDEYAINDRGDTVAFVLRQDTPASQKHSQAEVDDGYRIPNDSIPSIAYTWRSPWIPYKLWIQKKSRVGTWMPPSVVKFHSPFTGKQLDGVRCISRFALSLSPDGRQLIANIADIDMAKGEELDGSKLPPEWLQSPLFKKRVASGVLVSITVLHDMASGRTSMPIAVPGAIGVPQWTPDGTAFYLVANSPVGTASEREDEVSHPSSAKPYHIWKVEPATGNTDRVFADVRNPSNAILWSSEHGIGIRNGPNSLVSMTQGSKGWTVLSTFSAGSTEATGYDEMASNGVYTVLDYEQSDIPPQLRIYKIGEEKPFATVSLNLGFQDIEMMPSKRFQWTTSNGTAMTGLLLLPFGYVEGTRYPLVLQTKSNLSAFVCDAGSSHAPSFAPQPMASQGLMYLTLQNGDRNASYPSGYPGGIGEAAFYTDLWDRAVEELDRLGMVDPRRVGIIGFSRTGWITEFALVHAKTHYAASTATDNIQYSLGEYWLAHAELENIAMDSMYGGSPYGAALPNWIKYSISFNLDKIHTPLLIEAMGNGVSNEITGTSPENLNPRYEILSGLRHLNKPVEMYYYPNEEHLPDHPKARLASIQRNLDWYRFWLQGYERPHPEDPGQYARWHELRSQRDADLTAAELRGK